MPETPQRRLRLVAYARGALSGLVSVIVAFAIWQAAVSLFAIPAYVLPKPIDVWTALVAGLLVDPTTRASFWYQLAATLQATMLGFAIASVLGVGLAAVMAEFRIVMRAIFPYIVAFQSLPKIALAPLYLIWFGYQMESKVAMSATVALFPVLLNSLQGFAAVERERLDLMASLDASRWQSFWLIKFPNALPLIFAGLNLGIVYAMLGTLVAEFIGAQRGMGVIITQLDSVADTAGVFAILVVLGVTGYVLIAIVRACQQRVVFWSGEDKTANLP